jgi:hypothetical protein
MNKYNNNNSSNITTSRLVDASSIIAAANNNNNNNTVTLLYDTPPPLDSFPQWIQDYVTWHADMRHQFPGMDLFTNPNAPKLLVRTCLGYCGGLHDRLGQLPWDVYLANITGRVLLLNWQRPRALEEFLIPAYYSDVDKSLVFDWTIPPQAGFGYHDFKTVQKFPNLFHGYPGASRPTIQFWETDLDLALDRAISGNFSKMKLLQHRLLGHLGEDVLEQRLALESKTTTSTQDNNTNNDAHDDDPTTTTTMKKTIHAAPLFGNLFWLFFRPRADLDLVIRKTMMELHLQPGEYTAVHCRVRHPKAVDFGIKISGKRRGGAAGKRTNTPADKTGLPWRGDTKDMAIQTGTRALQCAADIREQNNKNNRSPRAVYFFSDSNDLVRHVALELMTKKPTMNNASTSTATTTTTTTTPIHYDDDDDALLYHLVQNKGLRVVARTDAFSKETLHLDKQKNRPAASYYATFVDLIIAIHAECVVYGVGYYAAFSAKLSGTQCAYVYQKEAWGEQVSKQAKICPSLSSKSNETTTSTA